MLLIFGVYVLICLYKVKVMPPNKNQYFNDYVSKEKSTSIKGIFILLVFFSHFNSYATFAGTSDQIYVRIVGIVGQAMVAIFMFYSGFGVMESIRLKGETYIRKIPQKRILSTWINFTCIVAVYALLALAVGNKITLTQMLLSFIGWDSVGNSNWYIFSILCLYLITYVSFTVCGSKKNYRAGASLSVVITGGVYHCHVFPEAILVV